NPTSSKFIHTWLRFGEIMRGSLRAEQPLREKFLRNMSQRAADILRDDLANRGPVRLSQVENEQKAILLIVRRLAETGEMVIGSGEDTYV
ncbi:FliG C-terminal domain-containing protein, partial [Escherichia coli]|uniref:FliG C-terminal domain-containing protein n=1 Tax=Escherichia coli TaxID=562 RepID=UPI0028E0A3D3